MKPQAFLWILIATVALSCNSSSFISKPGKEVADLFPQAAYTKIAYFQHKVAESENLPLSSNLDLVQDLWIPSGFPGYTLPQVASEGWVLKKIFTKREVRKLRKAFSDQGRMYKSKPCNPYVFNRCMVFVSEEETVVGTIFFCPKGYMVEAKPTLRPGIGKSFFWNEEGVEVFEAFIEKLEQSLE